MGREIRKFRHYKKTYIKGERLKMFEMISKKINNRKGFTLIELIVVIAILGVLAAIAVPRLVGSRDAAELRANQATARTILGAASMAEATYGDTFDIDDVNEFLDSPTVTDSKTGAAGTWTIDLTADPYVVRFGTDAIDLTEEP